MAKKATKKVEKKVVKKDVKKVEPKKIETKKIEQKPVEPKKVQKKEVKNDKTFGAIILSILILIVSQIASELVASIFHFIKVPEFICNAIAGILYILFAYILIKKMCSKYLKAKLEDYYIPKFKLHWHWIVVGFFLPLSVIATYQVLFKGTYVLLTFNTLKKLSIITTAIFFIGFGAGIVEEMVFRGIIMNALDKRFNKAVAIILPSVLFGFIHIIGAHYNFLSSLLVVIAGTIVGIMFSLIAQVSKSIWDSAIVHAIWNIFTTSGLFYISNAAVDDTLINFVIKNKSFIVTGGEFGIEASLISVIWYLIISVITFAYIKDQLIKKQIN